MTSSNRSWRWLWAIAFAALGCSAEDSLIVPGLEAPTHISATPLNMSGIRLDWTPGQFAELDRYRIERRTEFRGRFEFVAEVSPADRVYFDTELDPETFYGYRVVAINREGQRSEASTVAGARTAPLPGLRVETGLGGGTDPGVADPNGYRVTITGGQDTTFEIGTIDAVTISPLTPGSYTVALQDILSTCSISGGTSRQVMVVDTGLATRAGVTFTTSCADPTRGTVVAEVEVTGDSTDADGYLVNYDGIIPGDPVPVTGGSALGGGGGFANFASLRPGSYQLTLNDVEAPCAINGSATADVEVQALATDTVHFSVTCPDKGGGNPSAPLVLRHHWNPQSAGNGQTVDLEVAVDLSGLADKSVGALQANFRYDPSVLSYQSVSAPLGGVFSSPTVNSSTPGTINWVTVSTASSQPSAVLPVGVFHFSVTGTSGATTATRSQIELVADLTGTEDLLSLFRVEEDTFTVSGGGGGSNQNPTAQAGGPYSGTAGSPISFSSTGTSDPDGTIVSYSWDFGDGGSSTSQNPAHTYAAAGTYTANLTVTDNLGATGSAQAAVTVTAAGGGGSPFTWTSSFGAFESVLGTYPLSISLNLSTDIPETIGPETLGSFVVDSIVWDPAVLEYHSLAFGSGGGSFNTTNATGGCKCKLIFNGSPTSNSGVVSIGTIRFKPIGSPGSIVTTVTGLGAILSSPALGSFNYKSRIQVVEGSLTLP